MLEQLQLAGAFRFSDSLVVILDATDGQIVDANPAWEAQLGYSRAEMLGKRPLDLGMWVDPDRRGRIWAGVREGGRISAEPIRLRCRDGREVDLRLDAELIEIEGRALLFNILRLRPGEAAEAGPGDHTMVESYRALFHAAAEGIYRSLPDGGFIDVNPAMARIFGYASPAEMLGDRGRQALSYYADPEQGRHVREELEQRDHIDGVLSQVRRQDGRLIWVSENARVVRDAGNRPACYEGTVVDVTDRVAAEARLRESETRYRSLVEHSQVGVYLMHEDRYIYVNHTFATMFGYTEQELIGANFRMLVPPESGALVEARYRRDPQAPPRGDYEVALLHKDGRRIDVVVSAGYIELDGRRCTSGTVLDITERRQFERELEHLAAHDALTGLSNRRWFEARLAERIASARCSGDFRYAVLFLDLDGFKLLNDSLGHPVGDRLLLLLAGKLREALAGEALVARYGGDEFTILPHGDCPRARAEAIAARVLDLLRGPFEMDGQRVYSGASFGIVLGDAAYATPDEVLRDADTAMYRAKALGKAGYVIFDEAMHARTRERFALENALRLAVAREEFCVHYQPIVDLADGRVLGCEALIRWQHPERGLLEAPAFLDVAEETGLIVALDWWVLERSCRQLLAWRRDAPGAGHLRVNINIDERQFAEPGLLQTLEDVLARTGVDPRWIGLEVTETVFRSGVRDAGDKLRALKALGVGLIVDDFGTGYSSLDSFAAAPFDVLKIDASFVRDMEINPRHRAIVHTISRLAADLGLSLTAEGVETRTQADLLLSLGCSSAQGYLFAPALPAIDMGALLGEQRRPSLRA